MTPDDYQKFSNTMVGLGLVFGAEISEPLMDMYWMALGDWEITNFQAAAAELVNTCEFMPRPFDFNRLKKVAGISAQEAWGNVIEKCQGKATVPISDLTERAVRAVGGWDTIGHANVETTRPHIERRFLEVYESIQDADSARTALPMLASMSVKGLK